MSVFTITGAGIAPRLRALRAELARREDSEHVQALIRMAFCVVVSVYLYAAIGPRIDVQLVCLCFELLACAIFMAIAAKPQPSAIRRGFGAILDVGTTTYLMWTTAEAGAPLYGIYLWVIFGNGFRYGVRALRQSQALSIAGFALVVTFNPFWHQHALMAGGFLILLAAVPFYGAVLLKDVKKAQYRAEQANEAKSRFLSVMSHEIRTPLNGIIGINTLLRRTRVTPEQLDLINTLGMSSEILLSLLDNLLDIAKIEAGKMAIERSAFDLHSVIQGVHTFAATQAVSKGLRISVCLDAAVPRRLVGDPHRLRQVLINLLANALKFTHHGGVHLRIVLISEKNSVALVRCEVADTGVGMQAAALARIFEPFVQADQGTTREFGGSGLGTTIAKQLVERMGGKMGAESEPGRGSTFWFELPLPRPGVMPAEPALDGVRVLLAGLDYPLQEHILRLLAQKGAQVSATPANSAQQVLAAAADTDAPWQVVVVNPRDSLPSIVDVDAMLPGNTRAPRVIALSPPASDAERITMVNTPYSATVQLPLQQDHLLRAVHFAAHETDSAGAWPAQKSTRLLTGLPAHRLRVLVAEDNPTNRRIVAQILEYGGYDVSLCATGTQALESLHRGEFDVVILDKHMPGMSGLEVAARYLDSHQDKAAPMIMLTAEATAQAMEECKAAGMKAFLTKPIDPEMLFETIEALTGMQTAHAEESTRAKAESAEAPAEMIDEAVLIELDKHAYSTHFIDDVVASFGADMQEMIARLESAISAGHWAEIADVRHTIEGTARSSGATALVALLHTLQSLDTATPEQRQARVEELRACVTRTMAAMQHFIARRADSSTASAGKKPMPALLH